jgi:hypothetical protein
MKRREFLLGMAAPLAAAPFPSIMGAFAAQTSGTPRTRTRIRQSVMASVWTGTNYSFEQKCEILARIGFKGMDLTTVEQAPILKQHGLAPTLMTGTGTSFQDGLIRKEMHDRFEDAFHKGIDACAEVGCPSLIGFPGAHGDWMCAVASSLRA